MPLRIAVIGGGAAGASAAARARRWSPEAEILLFEAGSMITHAPCGIPYFIGDVVGDHAMLKTYAPSEFAKKRRINVHVNTPVKKIDLRKRVLKVYEEGIEKEYEWDRLVIATGAKPVVPRIEGVELRGVFTVRLPDGAPEVKRGLASASRVAIVGAGYIGLEMAEAVARLGKKVYVFEALSHVLPTSIDADVAEIVHEELISHGVELHLEEPVERIEGSGKVERIVTGHGSYYVDAVVLAVGVKPDVDLAVDAGIKLGVTGAIEVNEYMETSEPDVYAAGDAAETSHVITGKRVWIPLAPPANKMGQVAGANSVSPKSLKFPGVVGTAITKVFDYYVGRTGLTDAEAGKEGFGIESKLIKTKSTAEYYPTGETIHIKLTVEKDTGRVLGGQIVSRDKIAAGYTDLISVIASRGMTIEDVFFSDLSYSPPTSPVWHPVITAARVLSHGRF